MQKYCGHSESLLYRGRLVKEPCKEMSCCNYVSCPCWGWAQITERYITLPPLTNGQQMELADLEYCLLLALLFTSI